MDLLVEPNAHASFLNSSDLRHKGLEQDTTRLGISSTRTYVLHVAEDEVDGLHHHFLDLVASSATLHLCSARVLGKTIVPSAPGLRTY